MSVEIIGEKNRAKVIQRKCKFPLWALYECDRDAEIYENATFHRFLGLSVEIIEEKNRGKVIHSQFILPCSSRETRDFGRT